MAKAHIGIYRRLCVRPGKHIEFKVSVESDGTYDSQLVPLINCDIYSAAANFKEIEVERL